MALSLFHFSIPNPPKPRLRLRLRSSAADHPPSSLSPFDLRGYWSSIIADVEAELDTAIPLRDPRRIHEAMRHVVLAGAAKRAPSVMCVAACELAGGGRRLALPTAVALEMVHAAALAHDDLPCMDSAPLRRGRPSAHSLFGVDLALLAGDALLPLAISHLLSQSQSVPPIALARVAAEIARAVGPTAMIAGQLLDFHDVPADALAILELKFGEMAECAAACGGMIGGAGEAAVGRLRRYGRAVGVLYRLVDDITMAEDADGEVRSKASVVRAVGMDRALEIMEELQVKAKKELQGLGDEFGDRVLPLYSFVDYAVERGFVVESGERVIASRGHQLGVYKSWASYIEQVHSFSGATHKRKTTFEETFMAYKEYFSDVLNDGHIDLLSMVDAPVVVGPLPLLVDNGNNGVFYFYLSCGVIAKFFFLVLSY